MLEKIMQYKKVNYLIDDLLKTNLVKQLSWYTLAQFFVQSISFVSVIIISRYLGPTNLGLYSFVQNYVGAFLTIISGMDYYFTWKLSKSNNQFADLKTYIGHKTNIYVLLSIVGISLAWFILPKDVAILVSLMMTTIFLQSLNTFFIYAVIIKRAKLVAIVQISVALTMLFYKLILFFIKAPLFMFVIGAGVDLFLAGVIFSVYFFKSIPECRRAFFPFRTPKILSTLSFLFSIKLSIAALVFFQLLLRVDQLILATLSNAYTLGIYSAAVKISDIPNFLVGIISMALTSRISQISVKYDNESRKNLKYVMIYYIAVGIFISACIVVFAPLAVHVLYGTKFIDSVSVLRVYALSIPAIFLVSFFMSIYGARDKYKQQVIIFGSSLALNVFLIYVLTPFYGILGTAFATVVAYYFAAICLYAGAEKSSAKALKEDV